MTRGPKARRRRGMRAPGGCTGYDGCGNKVEVCRYWGVGHSIWSEGAKATWEFFESF